MPQEIQPYPALLVCAGKDSEKVTLLNSLANIRTQNIDEFTSKEKSSADHGIPCLFLETDEECSDLENLLPHCDLVLAVIDYSNREIDGEANCLQKIHTIAPEKPILILANAVNRSAEDFDGQKFDPFFGSSSGEKNTREWIAYLRERLKECAPHDVIPCAANPEHTTQCFNLALISSTIEELLPQPMRARWLMEERVTTNREEKAKKMIVGATTAAGAIGLAPLPVADMPFIISTQVALILSLCSLYGKPFSSDTAKSLSLAAISAVAGPMAFQAISKLIPGLGSFVGGGVAAACTYAVGKTTLFMLQNEIAFDPEYFKMSVRKLFDQYKNKKNESEQKKEE